MNLNASSGLTSGRKIKRVSDVKAMGSPLPAQESFNAYNDNSNQQLPPYNDFSGQTYVPPVNYQVTGTPIQGQVPFGMLAQPVVQDMALQYGTQLANTGKQFVKAEIDRYIPVTKLKYYFAVDTKYVLSKLKLLYFPFMHNDWSIKYEQDGPLQPRFELNAPDLYIPTMAYVTYVLLAGLVLGMQQRFSPEQIGMQASSALAWTIFEIFIYMATLYITNIQTTLKIFDLLAYGGYKYVAIITSVSISVIFSKMGYYISLIYCSLSLAFFLVRSLKVQVLPENSVNQNQYYGDAPRSGNKRRLYFLLFVAAMQPLLSWWLTYHLISKPVISQ